MKFNIYALLITWCLIPFLGQAQETLSLEDYMNYEWASNPQISPDGKQIIYNRNWINALEDRRQADLWIMNTDGSQNRSFIEGRNCQWSPDGKRVAFINRGEPKGRQIFVKYVGMEGEPTQITRLEKSPSNIRWSPDGQYIAFTMFVDQKKKWKVDLPAKPEGAKWTEAPRFVDQLVYRRDRVGFLNQGYTHIFVVPAEGGTARQITSGDWNHNGNFSWTPDGKHIIFSSLRIPDAAYAFRASNLYSVRIEDGDIKELTKRKGRESRPTISPSGKMIAFVGTEWTENFYHAQNLYMCNIDGSGLKLLSANLDRRIRGGLHWAADNSGIYFTVEDQGTNNLYFSSITGKWNTITEGNHMLSTASMSPSGLAVATRSSYQAPTDVVVFNVKKPQIKQITQLNEDIFKFKELAQVEEIRYKSLDDFEIQGWIVKPPKFDPSKKYPLILRIHGGPQAMYHVGFNMNCQLHAAEGYVVLYTNPRGSTGYGYDFTNAIQNAYPSKDYDDLMKGVDEVIKKGYIDENRLYVYGGSGGGVLTAWIVGHTNRFAAASANYPVINWLSFVGNTDGASWYKNFKKYPWEDPSEHIALSPLTYVGNVTTPTMLMTGVKDLRTPISQTEEFYQALKIRKVPSVMIRFNEEFHGTSSKPSNFMRSIAYLHYWFAQWPKSNQAKIENDKSESEGRDK